MDNALIIIGFCIVAAIVGAMLFYLYLRPQLISTQKLDQETLERNIQLAKESETLKKILIECESDERFMRQKLQLLEDSIAHADKQAKEAAALFFDQRMATAQEHLEQALIAEGEKYQEAIKNFQSEFQKAMEEGALQLNFSIEQKKEIDKNLTEKIAELRAIEAAAVKANKRAEEIKNSSKFYRIELSDADIEEIKMLRSVSPYLRDKEPLNKVIWKVYYEKPTTDMIGRVVGLGVVTGIYKITEISSGKCYVGQAANIADRWKQHIKRGVGADAPTRNKLYPAMFEIGPENFTFEIIEECSRTLLDEREDYWQDFFKAKEFGYSIK